MDPSPLKLFELSGKEDRRFSPFCWRARLALAHKGLTAEYVPVKFTDKPKIGFSQQERVPILVDGDRIVCESWDIACYLEDAYPENPSLFGGPVGRSLSRFVDAWGVRCVFPHLVRLVLCDVVNHLDAADAEYVIVTRERQLGTSFEAMRIERDRYVGPFRESLAPLRAHLRHAPFLGGETTAYADYSVFGFFQWARMISSFRLLDPDDPVHGWRERVLGALGGAARAVPAYDL